MKNNEGASPFLFSMHRSLIWTCLWRYFRFCLYNYEKNGQII
ncbi:hypothetical protein D922_00658 [Enterococcus faecalis 06-MB-DW-09]|nr:hypothetical protein D922_00658 [Enterococcus faecalis 06-MB-DW-09]